MSIYFFFEIYTKLKVLMTQAASRVDTQIIYIEKKDPAHLKHKISGGPWILGNQDK